MSEDVSGQTNELERIARVSDMLCTAHAGLRDRFQRFALWLDLSILGLSTWLVALAFVEPKLNVSLTPFKLDPIIWDGALGVGVFFLTIIQMKKDWKGRADAHRRTLDLYAKVKREARYLLARGVADDAEWRRILAEYDMASAVGIEMPESEFLKQKKRHRLKVAISRHLDSHPGASLLLTRLRLWARDNLAIGGKGDS